MDAVKGWGELMELTTPDNFRAALRVLVVEDSGRQGQLLELELRNQGYLPELERVTTRSELERALDRGEWDAILCDHVPPGSTPWQPSTSCGSEGSTSPSSLFLVRSPSRQR